MITAVEGPSAAGKTTWCRALGREFVPEYSPTGSEPDGDDRKAQAAYWVQVNAGRWKRALQLETSSAIAICDSDPLKLHYSWCLARIGADSWSRFEQEFAQVRWAMQQHRLGFVDTVFITVPEVPQLRRNKAADLTRTRRSFELHIQLREPLIEWYQHLEKLRPGSVRWQLPQGGLGVDAVVPRQDRYDVEILDALVAELPA